MAQVGPTTILGRGSCLMLPQTYIPLRKGQALSQTMIRVSNAVAEQIGTETWLPTSIGVVMILLVTHSTLNIMSLMGVIMMTGIVVSNSILIVEFASLLHEQGKPLLESVVQSCKIRLRPILMTSLATLLGMIPMALGLEAGSEQYAPLARAIIGGLGVSVVVTVFLVPAVYLLVHGRHEERLPVVGEV